ncbi:ammonia-forming cytochrome c nitrite reductase [Persicobacter sp. CCB-QB2]|uniref:ammonia-forming cytochrome c nitrite reductase n=1 Tax=Persicobacter sp. CCB-QB2 TaxID=1561025 RepID=UPI000A4EF831|nr:ammonia-forming cytochrome c nitrite reductase [Persicobacter sp. CCB-QB2]
MANISKSVNNKPWLGWLLFGLSLVAVFCLGLLASSITERRVEAQLVNKPMKALSKTEARNELWGENYPREYQSWKETSEMDFVSKYNGNVERDMLEEDPNLVVLWAGYGFSKDYNAPRGHFYAVEDIQNTLRTGGPVDENDGPMPATCWTCKSPDVPRMMEEHGVAEFYKGKWAGKGSEIVNPIGCADCHDSETMNLQISRPALAEAFERQGKDINDASHQEMRTLVCAQCHVEYYFDKRDGKENYLTFPWDEGFKVEDMEKYYDAIDFSDWTHSISKAPMLKAQHPGYETWQMGIHGQRGVSCADCHMPYKTEGGQKFTDHHIQSPLNNIANSCQVCHREDAETLTANVYERQDAIKETRDKVERELAIAHLEAGFAWEQGATPAQMKEALTLIRHAGWRWDFAVAAHGSSFHAPVEIARILGSALEKSYQARMEIKKVLVDLGYTKDVPLPDFSTKEKAQKSVGLDMAKLEKQKEDFKQNLLPKWLEEAKANGKLMK